MSYDYWLDVDTGGPEPHRIDPDFAGLTDSSGEHVGGNYTSNVSPVWACCLTAVLADFPAAQIMCGADARRWNKARPDIPPLKVQGDELCLSDLIGVRGKYLAPILRAATKWGREHADELRGLEPRNGWGSVAGALSYLEGMALMCEHHPNARLGISS